MVRRDLIASKLVELRDRVALVRAECPPSPEALANDRRARDLTAFYLMLGVQTCVDVASHVIADEGWAPARSLGESFVRLEENGVLSPSTAAALARAAGLRNVVAHGYAGVDVGLLHAAGTDGIVDLERFGDEVARWILRQPAAPGD